MANEPARPFWDQDIHPEVPSLGTGSSSGLGGLLKSLGGLGGVGDLAGLAKGLLGGGGGTNVRQSTSVSQATNIAFNPSIINVMGDGSPTSNPSGYASGSPSSSAPVYGDTLPSPGYMGTGNYGTPVYGARPYGDLSSYGSTVPVSAASQGPDLMTLLLIGAAGLAVVLFAGG